MQAIIQKVLLSTGILLVAGSAYAGKPLKVFILVGQSNMQGTGKISTAPHMAGDPKTEPLHDKLMDGDKPRVFNDVRITAISDKDGEKSGPLTFGYGSALRSEEVCGPELSFGVTMHEIVKEPILLIKTSWGGKSIHTDFRPPSAGLYPFHKGQAERYAEGKKKTVEEIIAAKAEATGHFYRLMAKHVKTVLADLGKYHPAYDKAAGYEIAGFVWFQGWNDMCDSHAYPRRHQPGGYKAYSDVLAHFIRDVRKEFKAPKMPFVIGVLGVGGPTSLYEGGIKSYQNIHQHYRDAMVAPAKLPEFAGNVTTVLTEKFWPHDVAAASEKGKKFQAEAQEALKKEQEKNPKLMGASAGNWWRDYAQKLMEKNMTAQERLAYSGRTNKDYHYLGCLKFYAQAGEAFAKANAKCSSFGER